MRVVAGRFRGRALDAPRGKNTRPMTDRVKETLFNILGHHWGTPGRLPELAVLDVFSGTGSLGIEALSRGAERCTFVERDRRALRALNDNLKRLKLATTCRVLTDNAWTMRPPLRHGGFGLIFVDPPYRDATDPQRVADLLERLSRSLAPDGLLVFRQETSAEPPAEEDLFSLSIISERIYRRMRVLLLTQRDDGESATTVEEVAGGEQVEEEARTEDVGDDADRKLDGPEAGESVAEGEEAGPESSRGDQ
jgi:16S rRNA (guanine966-N2)-methyltransferase